MKSFREFLATQKAEEATLKRISLFEHQIYKNIPGTKSSYCQDSGNTNTMTLKHAHAYAKPNGCGKELYSVNIDGSCHDGSSGVAIPSKHADHFRSLGYVIPDSNVLESLDFAGLDEDQYSLLIIEEAS